MKKIFAIILIVMVLSACSTLNKKKLIQPQKRDVTNSQIDMENSLMYFSLADVAMDENNYLDAYNALMKAYEYNPKSPEVLGKLAPLLLAIGDTQRDNELFDKLIEIGKKARKDKVKSDVLYLSVASAYLSKNNTKEANKYMDLMRKSTSDPTLLLHYYDFQKYFFNKEKNKVLKKAFATYNGDKGFEKMLLRIAELNPDKILKYTKQLYKRKNDKESLHLLVMVYRKIKREDDAIEFLKSKLKENADINLEDLRFFVRYLYVLKDDKATILEYFPKCSDDVEISSFILLSQYYQKNYNLALNCFERFDNGDKLSEIFGAELYEYLKFTLYLYTQNYDKTYKILNDSMSPIRRFGLLGMAAYSYKDTTLAFINYVKDHYQNNDKYHLYLVSYYKALNNMDEMEKHLDKLSDDFIKSEKTMSDLVGMLYLIANDNVDKAKRVLQYSANDSISTNYLVASNYVALKNDSLATKYLLEDLKTNKKPTISELYLLSQLFEAKKNPEDMLVNLYEDAIKRYPTSPSVLNLFGYYVADYSIAEKYDEAEKALLKACEISHEDINYIDSIAWLYYKMKKYDQALEWISKIPEDKIEVSDIAYHLGIIRLKSQQLKKSKEALQFAVKLNTSDKITNLAKQKLMELGEKNE